MASLGETRQYRDTSDQNEIERNIHQEQQQQQEFVEPTLCISRTRKNIQQKHVFAVLRQLNLGWVGKIDMVPKETIERNRDGTTSTREFMRVFIHFTKWFTNNRQTQQFLERLDSQGFVHIVYDEPWFWKVTKYVPKEYKPRPQSRYPRPRIDFGSTAAKESFSVSATSAPIVPIQVKRQLQSVSVSGRKNRESVDQINTKKYWSETAEIATATIMSTCQHTSSSPTPRYHDSDSESSPSPIIHRKVNVQLFN